MPIVSIIIPCFNYGHLLGETLDSVLAQTFQDWEAIIVDDGSTDNSREVAESYCGKDSRFRYFFQKNKGLSAARNKGIELSRGNYFQFLDADDLIEKRKLEIQVTFLSLNPKTDLVYGNTRFFDSDNPGTLLVNRRAPFDKPWMPCISGSGYNLVKTVVTDNIMVVHAPLVRKKLIEKTGYFDERLKAREDHEYWIRAAIQGHTFSYSDEPETLALTRIHLASMQGTKGYMSSSFDLFRTLMVHKILGADGFGIFNRIDLVELKKEPDWYLTVEAVCLYHLRRYKTGAGFLFGLKAAFISNRPFYQIGATFSTWFKRTFKGKH